MKILKYKKSLLNNLSLKLADRFSILCQDLGNVIFCIGNILKYKNIDKNSLVGKLIFAKLKNIIESQYFKGAE